MSIKDITLYEINTATVNNSGTTHHMIADSQPVVNGFHLTDISMPAFTEKVQLTFKSKNPVLDARTGLISKSKRGVVISVPTADEQGLIKFTTARFEIDQQPNHVSGLAAVLSYMLQLITDPDAVAYWENGV